MRVVSSLAPFTLLKMLLGCGILFFASARTLAQDASVVAKVSHSPSSFTWAPLENEATPLSDSLLRAGLSLACQHCAGEYECLMNTYENWCNILEERFHLPLAIEVVKEMASLAQTHRKVDAEAEAYRNISRFYDAMDFQEMAAFSLERSLELYQQANNQEGIFYAQMTQIERSVDHRPLDEVIAELNVLQQQAWSQGDSSNAEVLHIRLLTLNELADDPAEIRRHLAGLERIMQTAPERARDWGVAIEINLALAHLAQREDNLAAAERYYQTALDSAVAQSSLWLATHAALSLAKLSHQRQRHAKALAHLAHAEQRARDLNLIAFLQEIYQLKTQVAQAQGRYAEALAFSQQAYAYEAQLEKRSAGFDLEKYYLKLEREQLATEQQNQLLELELRNSQLKTALAVSGLCGLLLAGMVWMNLQQRRTKARLAERNRLIQRQSERLRKLDHAKSRFFANVSHELRTPLTLIRGPLHTILQRGQLSNQESRLLGMAQGAITQLEELVDEILTLGKLDSDQLQVEPEPVMLHSFFAKTILPFEALSRAKGIDFSYRLALPEEDTVALDASKCRQICNNLIGNAFKFTPAQQSVVVEVTLVRGQIHLTVADTGRGILAEDLPFLFERYFQTHQYEQPAEGGAGIGLALCQEYLELMEGSISVESEAGQGTVFRASWPVKSIDTPMDLPVPSQADSAAVPIAVSALRAPALQASDAPTILVVEDHEELRHYLELILQDTYQVMGVEHGQAALGYLSQGQPCDLVLSDLMMPVMDGFALVEALKESPDTWDLPVVMLTARTEQRDQLHALRIGVDDYLTKPFGEKELLARIGKLLENRVKRQEAQSEEPEVEADQEDFDHQAGLVWLSEFEVFVRENLADPEFSVAKIAAHFAMSESTLLRQLKRFTGLTPSKYLKEVRLQEGRRLLENRVFNSIQQVAAEVGYNDPRSFSRNFKSRFGKKPSEII
mgnify:CR=1 FL=1